MSVLRLFARSAKIGVIVVSLVLLGLFALAATEGGSQLALAMLSKAAGKSFTVDNSAGTLRSGLTLSGVTVVTPALEVTIQHLDFTLRLRALLAGKIDIEPLRIDRVRITQHPSDTPTSTPALSVPAAPVAIAVRHLTITDIGLAGATQPASIDEISFDFSWRARAMEVLNLHVLSAEHALNGAIKLRSSGSSSLANVELNVRSALNGETLNGSINLDGALDALAFRLQLEQPHRTVVNGQLNLLTPAFDAVITADPLALAGSGATALALSGLEVSAVGDLDSIKLRIKSDLQNDLVGDRQLLINARLSSTTRFLGAAAFDFDWTARGLSGSATEALAGQGRGDLNKQRFELAHSSGLPFASSLTLTLDDLAHAPLLRATIALRNWRLSLPDNRVVEIELGDFKATGLLDNLDWSALIAFQERTVGSVNIESAGRYSTQAMQSDRTVVQLLGGEIVTSLRLAWHDGLSGDASFTVSDLNLARFNDDLASALDVVGTVTVVEQGSGVALNANLSDIAGQWRGYDVKGNAAIDLLESTPHIRALDLAVGTNRLRAVVDLGQTLAGTFDIDFPNLAVFEKNLDGRLSANGVLAGARTSPAVSAKFHGQALSFQQWSVDQLIGNIDLDLARSTESRIDLDLRDIRRADDAVGDLALHAAGTPKAHALSLSLVGQGATASSALHGGMDAGNWDGVVDQFLFSHPRSGKWRLRNPRPVAVVDGTLTMRELCMNNAVDDASVCLASAALALGQGSAHASLTNLPLALANDFLPRTMTLAGALSGDLDLQHVGGTAVGVASLETVAGMLNLTDGRQQARQIPISELRASVTADKASIEVGANAVVGDWLTVKASASRSRSDAHDQRGNATLAADDIAWIAEFEPRLAGSRGPVIVDLAFDGPADAPRLRFDAALDGGRVFLPDLGLDIHALVINAKSLAGREVAIDATVASGDGAMAITGRVLADPARGWPGQLTIDGSDFALVRLAAGEVDVSPNLTIDIEQSGLTLDGQLGIPKLSITAAPAGANVVTVSPDEIIVNQDPSVADARETPAQPAYFTTAVAGKVDITLGDNVSINAVGVNAALAGQIHWTKERGQALGRAEGRVSIVNGAYAAYGQRLDITQGDVIFAGPIDNPSVNLRAVRPNLEVTAGVIANGSARAPTLRLFSQPSMSESDILSYLITGHALDDASSGEAGLIAQAALGLSAERSSVVTSQIQSAFGLDEFSVSAGETAQSTSLVAGKRITPKLSIRAGFNPFDRLWSVFLNYKISEHISVEAESGDAQGADVLYSLERDRLFPELFSDEP